MSTITREQLRERAREKVKSLEFSITQTAFADSRAELEEELELARIALASIESEPVYQYWCYTTVENSEGDQEEFWFWNDCDKDWFDKIDCKKRMLFTAPPAPESVPDGVLKSLLPDAEKSEFWFEHDGKILFEGVKFNNAVFDACRAAMLQGADGTLTNEGTIPVTQFKPVADLYGLTSPTGGETSFTFDAVEARDFIDGGWSCQEYVELGRFQVAMLQNGNSPAQSDCCPEQNYIAPAQDGNSPVIPDGWVLVPVEPTMSQEFAGYRTLTDTGKMSRLMKTRLSNIYRAMIAAAPQQEVK